MNNYRELSALFFITVLFCSPMQTQAIQPQTQEFATIAIDALSPDLNITDSSDAARLLRSLIAKPLFTLDSYRKIENTLTDAIRKDFRTNALSVRLKRNLQFSNGASIHINHIFSSLKDCFSRDPALKRLEMKTRTSLLSETDTEVWIDFPVLDQPQYNVLLDIISSCPIVDAASRAIFNNDHGMGANYISAGEFLITNYKSGNIYTLGRTDLFRGRRGVRQLEIVKADEPRRSLTMLRSGNIDALLTNDTDAIQSARQDATLVIEACFHTTIIKRTTFNFICTDTFQLREIYYDL